MPHVGRLPMGHCCVSVCGLRGGLLCFVGWMPTLGRRSAYTLQVNCLHFACKVWALTSVSVCTLLGGVIGVGNEAFVINLVQSDKKKSAAMHVAWLRSWDMEKTRVTWPIFISSPVSWQFLWGWRSYAIRCSSSCRPRRVWRHTKSLCIGCPYPMSSSP